MSEDSAIRVVLVEDDEDVRLSITQLLTLAGFEVDSFVSAERARSRIQVNVPAIVLCDVRLPGKSGIAWLIELRAIDAQEQTVERIGSNKPIPFDCRVVAAGKKPEKPARRWPT